MPESAASINNVTGVLHRCRIDVLLLTVFSVVVQAADYMSPGLTPEQILATLETGQPPLIVDVRSPAEFGIAHIPGAINVPVSELDDRLGELQGNSGVLIYCINGFCLAGT